MGDEVRRTQGGNNNAYCHDDPTGWFDWSGPRAPRRHPRFTKGLIRIRRRLVTLLAVPDETDLLDLLRDASPEWSGVRIGQPDLGDDVAQHRADPARRRRRAPSHLQRLLGAARLRAPLAERRPTAGGGSSTPASTRPTTSSRTHEATPVTTPTLPRRGALRGPAGRSRPPTRPPQGRPAMTGAERERMADAGHPENGWHEASPWYQWGPYLAERAWGSVREDYTANGDAWNSFPHDHARSRAYRWNEDGMAGLTDVFNRLSLGLVAVERGGPDPQGADVRADQPGGQPRRGRQGVLVVPRRGAEQRLAALALPLSAGAVPVRAS